MSSTRSDAQDHLSHQQLEDLHMAYQAGHLDPHKLASLAGPLLLTLQQYQQNLQQLRKVLLQVPHGPGDHSDLCRMHNQGLAPKEDDHCHCHVGAIRQILAQTAQSS
ncbi:hypothetical protein [Magnetococcus sp. PR-3]|uniref:hypothetical protein n=1 Tax=Magnetococcus sp. PR-3 TaxID=3120355 RepID=UPI002FCE320D